MTPENTGLTEMLVYADWLEDGGLGEWAEEARVGAAPTRWHGWYVGGADVGGSSGHAAYVGGTGSVGGVGGADGAVGSFFFGSLGNVGGINDRAGGVGGGR